MKLIFFFPLIVTLFLSACFQSQTESKTATESVYAKKINGLDGKPIDLEAYKGKVLVFVNIATHCGYTPQLEGLEALYKKYKDRGLELVGLPSNDFGSQTPEDAKGVKKFCKLNYGVNFELSEKIAAKNPDPETLVAWLTDQSQSKNPIKWNFEKFVLNRKGKLIGRFESKVTPSDEALVKLIEEALSAS